MWCERGMLSGMRCIRAIITAIVIMNVAGGEAGGAGDKTNRPRLNRAVLGALPVEPVCLAVFSCDMEVCSIIAIGKYKKRRR